MQHLPEFKNSRIALSWFFTIMFTHKSYLSINCSMVVMVPVLYIDCTPECVNSCIHVKYRGTVLHMWVMDFLIFLVSTKCEVESASNNTIILTDSYYISIHPLPISGGLRVGQSLIFALTGL